MLNIPSNVSSAQLQQLLEALEHLNTLLDQDKALLLEPMPTEPDNFAFLTSLLDRDDLSAWAPDIPDSHESNDFEHWLTPDAAMFQNDTVSGANPAGDGDPVSKTNLDDLDESFGSGSPCLPSLTPEEQAFLHEKASLVLEHLPRATMQSLSHGLRLDYRGEDGIIVFIHLDTLEIHLPSIDWSTNYDPQPSSQRWQSLSWNRLNLAELPDLIQSALEARQQQFHECHYCHRTFPQEHMQSEDVCHGCSSSYEGTLY